MGYVPRIIRTLSDVIIKMAWAGRFFILSIWLAPTYCDTIEEIALRVCPKTQISMDINVVTMPTAASDSVAFIPILPTTAASVKDRIGSDIPEINAGIASLFIFLKLIGLFKIRVHNNKMGNHFA